MRVLFATAELAPLVRVGGLAEAAGGLVRALRESALDLTVVLPDYGGTALRDEVVRPLTVPDWAGAMWARSGTHPAVGSVTLLGSDDLLRPHPYVDSTGVGWADNDLRFMQFSAAVAALRDELAPDVIHLNDWHTATATALGDSPAPTVLTIHTLGYQGVAPAGWMSRFTRAGDAFEWYGQTNPLAGAINLADRIVAVSPNYAREILDKESGMGLHKALESKGDALIGIRNGIDTRDWNPAVDPDIAENYTAATLAERASCRRDLQAAAGWEDGKDAVIGVVSRLVDQKGIDLLLEMVPYLETLPARLFVLGSGMPELADALRAAMESSPGRIYFHDGYDVALARRIFAGSDLFAMPSRFEPCGLGQMQAMQYGSIPVVTPVGGLVDTVIDADADKAGTGFISRTVDETGMIDAFHRAVRSYRNVRRRQALQRRGMEHDWSWRSPAHRYAAVYEELAVT